MNNNETNGKRYISDLETVKENGLIIRDGDKFTMVPFYSTSLKYADVISDEEKKKIKKEMDIESGKAFAYKHKVEDGDYNCVMTDRYFPSDRVFVAYRITGGEREYYVVLTSSSHHPACLTINVDNEYNIKLEFPSHQIEDVVGYLNDWKDSYYYHIQDSDFVRCCEAKELYIRINYPDYFQDSTVEFNISDMVYSFQALYDESTKENKYPDAKNNFLEHYDSKQTINPQKIEEAKQWIIETSQPIVDESIKHLLEEADAQLKYKKEEVKKNILWTVGSVICGLIGVLLVNGEGWSIFWGGLLIFISVTTLICYYSLKYSHN